MSTIPQTAVNLQSSPAAAIQSWAGAIRSTFIAGGWVQTADTGQTNATALAAATAANQSMGYEIWKMGDSLQASAPVFVKIEYGSGGNGTFNSSIWLTIGKGSDGAGNITGVLLPRTQLGAKFNSGAASTSSVPFGCATTSSIGFFVGGVGRMAFFIERTKNSSGADTGDGLCVYGDGDTIGGDLIARVYLYQQLPMTGTIPSSSTVIGAFTPSGLTWAQGNNVGCCPFRFFNGMPSNPGYNCMTYLDGDLTRRAPIVVSIYGVNHTYIPLGSDQISTVASGNANASLMMRYE